jgi:nucleosome binding factor SPN SPT16 subunit
MLKVFDQITSLKKAATKREAEKKEMADVVEQDKLIEIKGKLYGSLSRAIANRRSSSIRPQKRLSPSTGRG